MTEVAILGCLIGGGAMIVFAFVALLIDRGLGDKIKDAVGGMNTAAAKAATVAADSDSAPQTAGLGGAAQPQAAALSGAAEYVKALAELAGNLSKVSQAIAALLIATVLFGLAAGVAAVDDVQGNGSPAATPTATAPR